MTWLVGPWVGKNPFLSRSNFAGLWHKRYLLNAFYVPSTYVLALDIQRMYNMDTALPSTSLKSVRETGRYAAQHILVM